MAILHNFSFRCCGTCRHWLGLRTITTQHIEMKNDFITGTCSKKGCSHYGKPTEAKCPNPCWERIK